MNRRQPWGQIELAGIRGRLQILDPVTAFELEPDLLERLGDRLALALAAPRVLVTRAGDVAAHAHGLTSPISASMDDPDGIEAAAGALRLIVRIVEETIGAADIDGRWLAGVFERMIFGRLELDGEIIDNWRTWTLAGLRPLDRLVVLSSQLRQTFGPLWTRSPYALRGKAAKDYGTPKPSTPLAVQWAAALAVQGYASTGEILDSWTPERLIDVVDSAAYAAEQQRRASAAKVAG